MGRDYEFDYQLPGDRRRRRARSTLIDANPNGWLVFAHGDMGDALNARWITVITEAEPDPDARLVLPRGSASADPPVPCDCTADRLCGWPNALLRGLPAGRASPPGIRCRLRCPIRKAEEYLVCAMAIVPTMGRYDNLRKVVPAWLAQGMPVRLVVDESEYDEHIRMRNMNGWGGVVHVLKVPRTLPSGIGAARRFCVQHARRLHLPSIIMTDDDMKPITDAWPLIMEAAVPGVLGVGAVRSIHDHFTAGAISRNSGVIMCPGGWGFQTFGLNTRTAHEVGNFDSLLHSYGEDGELCRQGISRGVPWMVLATPSVADRRAVRAWRPDPAPVAWSLVPGQRRVPRACRRPHTSTSLDRPLRVAWLKMLDDFIPGLRCSRSAIPRPTMSRESKAADRLEALVPELARLIADLREGRRHVCPCVPSGGG